MPTRIDIVSPLLSKEDVAKLLHLLYLYYLDDRKHVFVERFNHRPGLFMFEPYVQQALADARGCKIPFH